MKTEDLVFIMTGNRQLPGAVPQPQPDQDPTPEQLQTLPDWAQRYIDELQDKLFGAENRASEAQMEAEHNQDRISELCRRRI